MPQLFGLDIAGIVNSVLKGQLHSGQLFQYTKQERAPANLTAGAVEEFDEGVIFEGFSESKYKRLGTTAVSKAVRTVYILGKSLPLNIKPKIGDKILIQDNEGIIEKVEVDTVQALYECSMED